MFDVCNFLKLAGVFYCGPPALEQELKKLALNFPYSKSKTAGAQEVKVNASNFTYSKSTSAKEAKEKASKTTTFEFHKENF